MNAHAIVTQLLEDEPSKADLLKMIPDDERSWPVQYTNFTTGSHRMQDTFLRLIAPDYPAYKDYFRRENHCVEGEPFVLFFESVPVYDRDTGVFQPQPIAIMPFRALLNTKRDNTQRISVASRAGHLVFTPDQWREIQDWLLRQ